MLDTSEGTCTCIDGYSSSEDERECLPGKGTVTVPVLQELKTNHVESIRKIRNYVPLSVLKSVKKMLLTYLLLGSMFP
jgi:hypothetical protein